MSLFTKLGAMLTGTSSHSGIQPNYVVCAQTTYCGCDTQASGGPKAKCCDIHDGTFCGDSSLVGCFTGDCW